MLIAFAVPAFAQSPADSTDASLPAAADTLPHFEPIEDRWTGIPVPPTEFYVPGKWYDPYNGNKWKGDLPIVGQNTFLVLTGLSETFGEYARLPIPTGVSTFNPLNSQFFGDPNVFLISQFVFFTFELYHGDSAFKPRDWELRITPAINVSYLATNEIQAVDINPKKGDNRRDDAFSFDELFFEKHLFNVSDRYDFVSAKVGIQFFNSDFREHIFADNNLGARLFGNFGGNRFQWNLAYFDLLEKDTNSGLNKVFDTRDSQVFVANLYWQDFIKPGYTTGFSFHYNKDKATIHYDTNGIIARPAPVGNATPHEITSYYFGWTSDGHLGRWNVDHALYAVFGEDDLNPYAGQPVDIRAYLAAFELTYDIDWQRYRASVFYTSGDSDTEDDKAGGFDTIVDSPVFAGGEFSYWQSQPINLLTVKLTQAKSFVPSLRTSKTEGQPNFVNPGILVLNLGYDAELTPKFKLVFNGNYLQFVNTSSVELFINQNDLANPIGIDLSVGSIYRPWLNNNVIFKASAAVLAPMSGWEDIYENSDLRFAFLSELELRF